MTVSYNAYDELKKDFFRKHHNDYKIKTGPMDGYGNWNKDYVFEDGSVWSEVYSKVVEPIEVEVHYCKVRGVVTLLKTEFYSTDDSKSRYYYEEY